MIYLIIYCLINYLIIYLIIYLITLFNYLNMLRNFSAAHNHSNTILKAEAIFLIEMRQFDQVYKLLITDPQVVLVAVLHTSFQREAGKFYIYSPAICLSSDL